MISGRMGLWLAAQQAVLRQQLQPLAAKPGSGGGSPPHISAPRKSIFKLRELCYTEGHGQDNTNRLL